MPWIGHLQAIAVGIAIVAAVAGALLAITWPVARDLCGREDD